MKKPDGIDIIVPIYNAYEDLRKCVASLLAYTDLKRHRLLFVNDASPDERIFPYLKSLEQPHVLVIENETNLGFSGSINHGIHVSGDRDVILLNSDTIVTQNWVEKMIACAYSEAAIATVTPLSNNATLCSVPDFLGENTIPDGFTLEKYAELIEHVSLHEYPTIPVANGFCMYIKREVIDRIGVFDQETFGRGYGEENDFCYRALQVGYRHAMCDDTYIYHSGTASFVSEEKRKYIEAHEKILNERYPDMNHAVAVHCRDNPNAWVQENIRLWTGLNEEKKKILYLVQSDFREDADDHYGGTQLHVKDMMTCMRGNCHVFVAARNREYLNLTAYTEKEEYPFRFYIGKVPEYTEFRNRKMTELYGKILDTFRIDLVHIHHTKDLTLELYYEAEKRDIPVVTTLHDYFTACPRIKLVDSNGKLCLKKESYERCAECMKQTGGIRPETDYLRIWRDEQRQALAQTCAVVVPSKSAKEILLSYYPELGGKMRVIPHGMQRMERKNQEEERELHVAFIGGVSPEKGSDASLNLIKNGPKEIQWYLFGIWGYNGLSMTDRKNYTKTGLYERQELPELMAKHKIDLVCILPIWPETYCYTLSEAIMCGVPAIVTDIGALGERMRELNCGWLVSAEHAYEETLAIINRIKDKGPEYREKREYVKNLRVKTLNEMRDEYLTVYREAGLKQEEKSQKIWPELSSELRKKMLDGYLLAQGRKICLEADAEEVRERLEQLDAQLTAVTTSFTYKCMRALGEVKIPGRKYIKKMMYAAYRFTKK